MNRVLLALLLLSAPAWVGCDDGRAQFYAEDPNKPKPVSPFEQIKYGMTEEEVIAILGPPQRRSPLTYPKEPHRNEVRMVWDNQLGRYEVLIVSGKLHQKHKK